jgi:lysosomal alpha-glucosidase
VKIRKLKMQGPIKNIFRKITNFGGVKTDETQPIDSGFNEQKINDDTSSVMKETSGAEFNRLHVHYSSTTKLTPDDSKCPRPNVSTFLILLLVIILFMVIPIVNLLHFFHLLNSQWPSNEFNRVMTDHSNSNTRKEIMQERENTVVFHNIMRQVVEIVAHNNSVSSSPLIRPPKSASFKQCAKISDELKFDCYPEGGATESLCKARGCCWVPKRKKLLNKERNENNRTQSTPLNVPYCFYPLAYGGYRFINITETPSGSVSFLQRTFKSPYPDDVEVIRMDIRYEAEQRLRIKVKAKAKPS